MSENLYLKLYRTQEKRIHDFISEFAFFAFNDEQLEKGLQKFGIQREDMAEHFVRFTGGGFMLKSKVADYMELSNAIAKETEDAIHDAQTGPQFAYQMFYYELCNHEYSYTGDTWETLEALGMNYEEVREDPILFEALRKACKDVIRDAE